MRCQASRAEAPRRVRSSAPSRSCLRGRRTACSLELLLEISYFTSQLRNSTAVLDVSLLQTINFASDFLASDSGDLGLESGSDVRHGPGIDSKLMMTGWRAYVGEFA